MGTVEYMEPINNMETIADLDSKKLSTILRDNGVVGAGGAGFPTYMKIDERANTIVMNCAECEPLLRLHRQLLEENAYEIMKAFQLVADVVGAEEAIIGIKKEYHATIEALLESMEQFPKIRLHYLDNAYPVGDEVALIYETTKRIVRPGGLPIEEGIAVFNVETVYNIYRALEEKTPVIDKLVTVVGEVQHPITVRVPIGTSIQEVVALAGNVTVEKPVYMVGGPMMGSITTGKKPITKTTNAILVLPEGHLLVQMKKRSTSVDLKRAASACCQCQMCTDLCPRHELGYPIEPHKFMRYATRMDVQDPTVFLNTMFCSSCGLCEMYSCPQGLSPRTLITEYKNRLRKAGVKPPKVETPTNVSETREYRKAPEPRLEARIGLAEYHKEAPLNNEVVPMKKVKILLSQHIGTPAKPIVTIGEFVQVGQQIAKPVTGLSVGIHASISGKVTEVNEQYIMIKKA